MRIAGTILAAGLLALAACKGPGSVQDASAKVASFHRQLDAGDFEAIWRDSGPDMKNAGKAGLVQLLGAVHTKLGKVKASKQVGWRSEVNTSGSYAQVTMDTQFERGTGQETFLYSGSGPEQRLAGYHINSNDMMLK